MCVVLSSYHVIWKIGLTALLCIAHWPPCAVHCSLLWIDLCSLYIACYSVLHHSLLCFALYFLLLQIPQDPCCCIVLFCSFIAVLHSFSLICSLSYALSSISYALPLGVLPPTLLREQCAPMSPRFSVLITCFSRLILSKNFLLESLETLLCYHTMLPCSLLSTTPCHGYSLAALPVLDALLFPMPGYSFRNARSSAVCHLSRCSVPSCSRMLFCFLLTEVVQPQTYLLVLTQAIYALVLHSRMLVHPLVVPCFSWCYSIAYLTAAFSFPVLSYVLCCSYLLRSCHSLPFSLRWQAVTTLPAALTPSCPLEDMHNHSLLRFVITCHPSCLPYQYQYPLFSATSLFLHCPLLILPSQAGRLRCCTLLRLFYVPLQCLLIMMLSVELEDRESCCSSILAHCLQGKVCRSCCLTLWLQVCDNGPLPDKGLLRLQQWLLSRCPRSEPRLTEVALGSPNFSVVLCCSRPASSGSCTNFAATRASSARWIALESESFKVCGFSHTAACSTCLLAHTRCQRPLRRWALTDRLILRGSTPGRCLYVSFWRVYQAATSSPAVPMGHATAIQQGSAGHARPPPAPSSPSVAVPVLLSWSFSLAQCVLLVLASSQWQQRPSNPLGYYNCGAARQWLAPWSHKLRAHCVRHTMRCFQDFLQG